MSAVQSGCFCLISSERPAIWGEDMDVPLSRSQRRPPWFVGATAARTSTPGAAMSGLSRSPVARLGPREEKPAMLGASTGVTGPPSLNFAVGLAVPVTYALIASPVALSTCVAGATWTSATWPAPTAMLAMIVPTPPASATAAGLSTRAFVGSVETETPRLQTTILPATFAESSSATPPFADLEKHCASFTVSAPATPAFVDRITGFRDATPGTIEVPVKVAPLPSVIVSWNAVCVLAATVVSQGLGCATVETVGPLLPADAATNTPASSAKRNATSTEFRKLVVVPLIE